jgi:hypothetical protein
MPIRALIVPIQPVHAGFVERLRFHCMEQLLKNGWTTEDGRTFGGISEHEARRQVTYARMHGLVGVIRRLGARATANRLPDADRRRLPTVDRGRARSVRDGAAVLGPA